MMIMDTSVHMAGTETSTPQAVAKELPITSQVDTDGLKNPDLVFSRSLQGSYDLFLSTASNNLSSATGDKATAREGAAGQDLVPFTSGAISVKPGGASNFMTGDPEPSGGSELSQSMSASDQGKRLGLTRGRSRSQSGASRRPVGRQSAQTSSQQRHDVLPSNPPEIIHNIPSAPVGFQGPPAQYVPPSSPYDQRAAYTGQYPPSQGLAMGLTPPPFAYAHGYHHPGGLRGPQDPSMLPQNAHPGFQPMIQPHGTVYPYQRHSPEGMSPAHSFPGGYHQVAPSPPVSPLSASASGAPSGASLPPSFAQAGQFPSLQYSATPSSSQYPGYIAPTFPSSPSMYPSQYTPSPYPQSYQPPPSSDAESQGTWWYLPHGHGAPPPPSQYDSSQPSYHGHYPIGYSHLGRDVEAPYNQTGSGPAASTPPVTYSLSSRGQQASRIYRSASPSLPAVHDRMTPASASPTEPPPPTNASTSKAAAERPAIRRPYHPNPPSQRSEWVMWTGNVPSDTVHDELWRFFKQPTSKNSTRSASPAAGTSKLRDDQLYDGVSSIFLIARSNCAFVNFETEAHLHSAIERFNGKPLRPNDPRCPRLVCRVRRKDDDLKAGVGGQRGMGIHKRWVKEKEAQAESSTPSETASSTSERLGAVMAGMSLSSDEEHLTTRTKQSSGSGSHASTNSSMLARYFPKRYFILKSLTQSDLDLSVEKGLWATQRHNEGILDQAYRTSTDVYLIFGVNKSGEFYGYAKMAGPILHGEHRVSWASRTSDSTPSSRSSLSPVTGRGSRHSEDPASPTRLRRMEQPNFFSPVENRLVEESPMPLSTPEMQEIRDLRNQKADNFPDVQPSKTPGPGDRVPQSAPAELGPARSKFSKGTPRLKQSLGTDQLFNVHPGPQDLPIEFQLDPAAPIRAQRNADDHNPFGAVPSLYIDGEKSGDQADGMVDGIVDGVVGNSADGAEGQEEAEKQEGPTREGWGESFKVEWISTTRLPFYRTRHLRNPWNHDREIKVSRDGTELEPSTGQRLLDEWETMASEPPVADQGTAGTSRRAATSTPALQPKDSLGGKRVSRRS